MSHATLTITRQTDGYEYVWRDADPANPRLAHWHVPVDHEVVGGICAYLTQLIEGGSREGDPTTELRDGGQRLFDVLVPDTANYRLLRERLRELRRSLTLALNDGSVLWELLHDGEEFWGRHYGVGRTLLTGDHHLRGVEKPSKRALLIVDPQGDLEKARDERKLVEKILTDGGYQCRVLEGAHATHQAVTQALISDYAFIHYCGHIEPAGNEGRLGLLLHDQPMPLPSIRGLIHGRPIVFLNGCNESSHFDEASQAMAGARIVVGSVCKLPEVGAGEFAARFYEFALDGYPFGEAMRRARRDIANQQDLRLAWACYVLYGDPTFRCEVPDRLERELKALGLSRDDFDPPARKALEQAFELGFENGVRTAHLLLTLSGGSDKTLARWLQRKLQPGPGEDYKGVLERLLKQLLAGALTATGVERRLSDEVREVLLAAKAAAGSLPVTEAHLMRALACSGGGAAGVVLKRFGADLRELCPGGVDPPPRGIGPITAAECSEDGWRLLEDAIRLATQGGCPKVATVHLLGAIVASSVLPAGRNLHRLHMTLDLEKAGRCSSRSSAFPATAPATSGTGLVLTLAQANASPGGGLITPRSILEAFIQAGGGTMGAALANNGRPLRLLVSELIGEHGSLNTDRCDAGAVAVLNRGAEFANRKGFGVYSSAALVYGLLRPGGFVARRVLELTPERPAEFYEQLFHLHFRGRDGAHGVETNWRVFSPSVRRVLCLAEGYANQRELAAALVTELDLLRALQEHGGGEGGKLLLGAGLPFGDL